MSANTGTATSRPGVLTAAVAIIVLTALAALVNGIMIATGGTDLIKDILVEGGLPAGIIDDATLETAAGLAGYGSLDEFVNAFAMRGYLVGGAGVALLVLGGLMWKAATWVRVLATLAAALAAVFAVLIVADDTTKMMAMLCLAVILGAVLSIVFTWLPAIGRYAKASST